MSEFPVSEPPGSGQDTFLVALDAAQSAMIGRAERLLEGGGRTFQQSAAQAVALVAEITISLASRPADSGVDRPGSDAAFDPDKSEQRAVYLTYMNDLLAHERVRKTDLQQRGIGVVTTSSVLSALFFGFVTAIVGSSSLSVPGSAEVLLALALGCFAAAAAFGILTDWAMGYKNLSSIEKTELENVSAPDAAAASEKVADWTLQKIENNQRSNLRRSRSLTAALGFDAAAAMLLAISVALILVHGT